MKVIHSVSDWKKLREENDLNGKPVGFVPTMGHLHQGHESLIRKSVQDNDITVLSIFVNPLQFNQNEDYTQYPRTLDKDLEIASQLDTQFVFVPEIQDMYSPGEDIYVEEKNLSKILEGEFRPGHFSGVLTIVLKLLNLVRPHKVYLGEKDYQQYSLIKKMVHSFFLDVEVICCPTVRLESGLALSSRNSRLSSNQIRLAENFAKLLKRNESDQKISELLENEGFEVEYVTTYQGRRYGAIWLDQVRLIDNIKILE